MHTAPPPGHCWCTKLGQCIAHVNDLLTLRINCWFTCRTQPWPLGNVFYGCSTAHIVPLAGITKILSQILWLSYLTWVLHTVFDLSCILVSSGTLCTCGLRYGSHLTVRLTDSIASLVDCQEILINLLKLEQIQTHQGNTCTLLTVVYTGPRQRVFNPWNTVTCSHFNINPKINPDSLWTAQTN